MPQSLDTPAREYLESSRAPLRLACATRSGWPTLVSLWYLVDGETLWCATPAHAQVVRWLERDSRCGFEVSGNDMPYRGVRGRARARIEPSRGSELRRRLAQRYLGDEPTPFSRWLLSRPEPEVALALTIERVAHWDFSRRMGAQ